MSDKEILALVKPSFYHARVETVKPRSSMMLNPLKLKHLNTIDDLTADIIILNLEDGVAKQKKRRALYNIALFYSHLQTTTSNIVVRINPLDEGGEEEIKFLNSIKPQGIRVAKIKTPKDVKNVLDILDDDIQLHLSIETKQALDNLTQLNINNRVQSVSLGIMDMLNSLGLTHSLLLHKNPLIHYILSKFVVDSAIAETYPLGFTYQNYHDKKGFKQWLELEKSLGITGTSCLGPLQVAIAHEVFKPTQEEITKALYIKSIFEKMQQKSITGFMDEKYGFIDEPIYKDAILIIKKV